MKIHSIFAPVKRIVSILLLSAAALVLTALSLVPHHHHGNAVCTVVELCKADSIYNDRHTGHDASGESESEGCVVHASYAPSDVLTGVAAPCVQAALQAVSPTLPAPAVSLRHAGYGLCIIAYTSVVPVAGGGLRAPPTLS